MHYHYQVDDYSLLAKAQSLQHHSGDFFSEHYLNIMLMYFYLYICPIGHL